MKKAFEYFIYTLFIFTISFFVVDTRYKSIILNNEKQIYLSENDVSLLNKDQKIQIKSGDVGNVNSNKLMFDLNNFNFKQQKNNEDLFQYVKERIKLSYIEDIDDDKIYENAMNGMLSSLDPHSAYLSKKDFKEMQVQTKGEFGGLGIVVTKDSNFIKVVSPIDDTPAARAGILSGDYISQINDKQTFDMSLLEAVDIMRGKVGEKVKITVLRTGETKPLEFELKREKIKIDSVKGEVLNNNIIYIRITNFIESTQQDTINMFNNLKSSLNKNELKGVVLDLRNNPGGLLDQSVKISELFLDKDKTVVSIKGKNEQFLETYKTTKDNVLIDKSIPLIVLVNEGSASASEIVAGALQDHNRAVILGVKTFGKASVQQIFPLGNGGAMKITIARYYTPLGRSIQLDGIVPDIIAEKGEVKFNKNNFEIREKDLQGHLEKENKVKKDDIVEKTIKEKAVNNSNYITDYQLLKAIDLIKGINFFNNFDITKNEK